MILQKLSRFKQHHLTVQPLSIVAVCLPTMTVLFATPLAEASPLSNLAETSHSSNSLAGSTDGNRVLTVLTKDWLKDTQARKVLISQIDPAVSKEQGAIETARKEPVDKMSLARPKEVEDLPNFHQVHPFLYRGGEPSPAGLRQLAKMGVKTLIDLRAQTEAAHNEEALAAKLGMKYINLTMTAEAPTAKQVDVMLRTIDSAKEKNEPVLVHCAHGSDRTGCMVGIWRVTRDGWSFDDTYKEMRKYWFGTKYLKLKDAVKSRAAN